MFRPCSITQGEAARLYRSPADIRRDMSEISARIKSASDMLNTRSMLMDIIEQSKGKSLERFLIELEDMIGGTRDSLRELSDMRDMLCDLAQELEDARWAAGI